MPAKKYDLLLVYLFHETADVGLIKAQAEANSCAIKCYNRDNVNVKKLQLFSLSAIIFFFYLSKFIQNQIYSVYSREHLNF
jgi:hypothetical protein